MRVTAEEAEKALHKIYGYVKNKEELEKEFQTVEWLIQEKYDQEGDTLEDEPV